MAHSRGGAPPEAPQARPADIWVRVSDHGLLPDEVVSHVDPIRDVRLEAGPCEESLWDTANKLRGSVESSEYKHVVLSLIFLKFVSDKFEERRAELVAEGKEDYLDMVEFYTMQNVFYLPETSRWRTTPRRTAATSKRSRPPSSWFATTLTC